jgi:YgiT-type zinc finger domain-containing protein
MEFLSGMVCPVCETGIFKASQEDLRFEYKGIKTILPKRGVFRCEECEESFINPKEEREIEKLLTDERRKIDETQGDIW